MPLKFVDPVLADILVGEAANVFVQQQPDHEPACDPKPTLLAVERCYLAIDPVTVDLAARPQ